MKRHIDFKILFLSFVIALCVMVGVSVIFGFITVVSHILLLLDAIILTALIYNIFNE